MRERMKKKKRERTGTGIWGQGIGTELLVLRL